MPKGIKRRIKRRKTISSNSSEEKTLGVMRGLVHSLTHSTIPDPKLLDSLQNYFRNLQDSANLMGLAVFQHNLSKILRVVEGIEVLHEEVLNPQSIRTNTKKDPYYGLELLKILYKEAGIATLMLEGKSKLFDEDVLRKSNSLQPKRNDEGGSETLAKIPPKSRENIRRLFSELLEDGEFPADILEDQPLPTPNEPDESDN